MQGIDTVVCVAGRRVAQNCRYSTMRSLIVKTAAFLEPQAHVAVTSDWARSLLNFRAARLLGASSRRSCIVHLIEEYLLGCIGPSNFCRASGVILLQVFLVNYSEVHLKVPVPCTFALRMSCSRGLKDNSRQFLLKTSSTDIQHSSMGLSHCISR